MNLNSAIITQQNTSFGNTALVNQAGASNTALLNQSDNTRSNQATINLTTGAIADLSQNQTGNNQSGQTNKIAGTNDLDPRFSPTGASGIFTNTDNTGIGQRNVYTVDANGQTRKLLLSQAEMPYWR